MIHRHVERLYGAFAIANAGRDRHRHERERGQAMGRLQQFCRRSCADISGRRRHGSERSERPPHQESLELIQRDFEGNVIWRFDHNEQIQTRGGGTVWSARQHHDWQREDFPAGYYSPESRPRIEGSNTLILTHGTTPGRKSPTQQLEDDRLIEVSSERRHRLGVGCQRPHRRIRLRRRRRKCDQGCAGRQRRARQFRLAAHQLGNLCRAEPLV